MGCVRRVVPISLVSVSGRGNNGCDSVMTVKGGVCDRQYLGVVSLSIGRAQNSLASRIEPASFIPPYGVQRNRGAWEDERAEVRAQGLKPINVIALRWDASSCVVDTMQDSPLRGGGATQMRSENQDINEGHGQPGDDPAPNPTSSECTEFQARIRSALIRALRQSSASRFPLLTLTSTAR